MATMNIYLPDELRERMRSHDLNWSKVSADAIESAINIENLKGENPMQAQLERLRKSKESNEEREHAEGVAAGKKWALESAEYDELERVVEIDAGDFGDPDDGMNHLAGALSPDVWLSPNELKEEIGGSSNSFIEGFIEGAAEVFKQV